MALPNFFIAGAPKAGTDLLFYQLDQHPQIYMSPLKEPNFFAEEIRPARFHPALHRHAEAEEASTREYLDSPVKSKRFGGIVSTLSDYEVLFQGAYEQTAIGEGSVCYLWSKSAAAAIARLIPHARILITLMDPSTRAFHQYLKSFSDNTVSHDFARHLDLAFEDRLGDRPQGQVRLFNPFLSFGEYFEQIGRFFDAFPKEQLFISLYEDTLEDPHGWFERVLTFLNVDSAFSPREVAIPSKTHFTRDRPEPVFLQKDRARLVAFYRNDILRVQEFIQRDLTRWLL